MDLTQAALSQDSSGNLVATITVKSLATLLPSPTSGGTNAGWLLRWTVVTPGTVGNGHIYYAGMESSAGGAPRYFDGDMQCQIQTTHCKYFTYPGDHTIIGSYNAGAGVITLTVPKGELDPGSAQEKAESLNIASVQAEEDDPGRRPRTAEDALVGLDEAVPGNEPRARPRSCHTSVARSGMGRRRSTRRGVPELGDPLPSWRHVGVMPRASSVSVLLRIPKGPNPSHGLHPDGVKGHLVREQLIGHHPHPRPGCGQGPGPPVSTTGRADRPGPVRRPRAGFTNTTASESPSRGVGRPAHGSHLLDGVVDGVRDGGADPVGVSQRRGGV